MRVYVVLETSGGWGGTEVFHYVYRAYMDRADAERYVAECKRDGVNVNLWEGEIHEVELTKSSQGGAIRQP